MDFRWVAGSVSGTGGVSTRGMTQAVPSTCLSLCCLRPRNLPQVMCAFGSLGEEIRSDSPLPPGPRGPVTARAFFLSSA